MNELKIKTHDFEVAKSRLKEFSQKKTEELELNTVRTADGWFGLLDHKVTGDELNSRLVTIQQHLVDLNDTNNQTIKEFGQIYNALEALDRDYIQAILKTVNDIEDTSESVKDNQKKLSISVNNQKKTLDLLRNFKEDISESQNESQKWRDDFQQKWDTEIPSLSNKVSANKAKIDGLHADLSNTVGKIAELKIQLKAVEAHSQQLCEIEKIVHLHEIDEMWEKLSNAHSSIMAICTELNSIKDTATNQQSELETLSEFGKRMSGYEHLQEIDEIWSKTEDHSDKLDCLFQQSDDISEHVRTNERCIDELLGYKQELCGIMHLNEVDELWETNEAHSQQLCEIEKIVHLHEIDEMWEKLSNAHSSIVDICTELNSIRDTATNQQSELETLLEFEKRMSGYEHLQEIDEIWSKTEDHSDKLDCLFQQSDDISEHVRTNERCIDELLGYKQELCGIMHLNEVDELWETNEAHSQQLSEIEKKSEETISLIQNNKELIEAALDDMGKKNDLAVQMLTKKIKNAYLIAGGSLGLALIELVAILMKVI